MGLLIFFFVLSIAFSFLCSVLEAVLLSITPSYISTRVQEGKAVGLTLKRFKDDIDRPLSAVLTLNTIAHTVGAIGVGAQAGKLFSSSSFSLGPLDLNMEAVIAGVMTLAILVLSEIIPKTLGANYWKNLTPFTVYSLQVLLTLLAPFVWLSQLITKNLKKDKSLSVFSRADFRALTLAGEESGALKEAESRTIKNLLRLDQITVKNIMTPRSVMLSAEEDETLEEFYKKHMPIRYSRIPVFDDEKERINGIMLKNDLFQALIEDKGAQTISTIMRPADFIRIDASLADLQDKLIDNNSHLTIVTDEYGVVLGLVSLEDLMETILGLEIIDEMDDVEDLQKHAREIWEKRAKMIHDSPPPPT